MSYCRLLDLRVEKSFVVRYVKLPRCREASRKPRVLCRTRAQAINMNFLPSLHILYQSLGLVSKSCRVLNSVHGKYSSRLLTDTRAMKAEVEFVITIGKMYRNPLQILPGAERPIEYAYMVCKMLTPTMILCVRS